ncbi:MAG: hypothetical protein SFU86_08750 [Pirellulaceae bacterium]|nr:hypothetical protein [Pirellulaceae bacterium]
MRQLTIGTFPRAALLLALLAMAPPLSAGEPTPAPVPDESSFVPSPAFQDWLTELAREQMPHQYEKRRNWGHTRRVASGLSIQLDDGQLKTHRQFREANDGRWTMYRVELIDPDERFAVRVLRVEERMDGLVGLDVEAVARVHVLGKQALWERGVQIFSLSAEADASVRLSAHADVALQLNPTKFPPDVSLKPTITAAQLDILDFDLRRVGLADGPVVRSFSDSAREMLEDKLTEDNAQLVEKLNKSLAKHEGKLKLSLAELLQTGVLKQGLR